VNTLFTFDGIGSTNVTEMKSDGGKMARKRIKDYKEEASLVGYIQIDNKFKNKRVYV